MALVTRGIRHPAGHMTSMRMSPAFWSALSEIAKREGITRDQVIRRATRQHADGLSEVVRTYVLNYFRRALAECEAKLRELGR